MNANHSQAYADEPRARGRQLPYSPKRDSRRSETSLVSRRSRLATNFLTHFATEITSEDLARPTVVFSPHPDDECLGCGGTILKKKQLGAPLKIVHMTDGCRSHPASLIPKDELTAVRRREAQHAGKALGADDVCFLDFDDQALMASEQAAIERVREILWHERPEDVFVPYRREPRRQAIDHIATTNIVLAALSSYSPTVTVWEYPVWFWFHWPWVGFKKGCLRRRFLAENSVKLLLGSFAFLELGSFVDTSEFLNRKIAALAEHRSQMTELIPSADWTTLGKISGGEWLEMFYLGREFFRRTIHQGHA
jgi:LmbE family N-acetylglucosaminyl deacetylase